MAQRPKILNTRQSYIPVDPQSFIPQSYTNERSDAPDEIAGAVPYDGKNFLPTAYGYKSFFGLNAAWEEPLPAKCQELLFMQLDTLENMAVALCDDGIWCRRADAPWVRTAIDHGGTALVAGELAGVLQLPDGISFDDISTFPELTGDTSPVLEQAPYFAWTYCMLENSLYAYRSSSRQVWRISSKAIKAITAEKNYSTSELLPYTADLTGELPIGVYTVFVRMVYLEKNPLNEYEEIYSELISFPNEAVTIPGAGFQLKFAEVERAVEALDVFYQIDGGNWAVERIYPTPGTTINILWNTLGEAIEVFPPADSYVQAGQPIALYPTFLNMAGQQGIFRAGFQLGFWDSANAIACSSVYDVTDFTPSVETLASVTSYPKVTGRIVQILPEENNFVIYATKSIVRCVSQVSATTQWESVSISQVAGIAYPGAVTSGLTEGAQYAYTSAGIAKIEQGAFEIIFPELYDILKQRTDAVVYLKMLEGRYLFISSLDPIFGPVIFENTVVDPLLLKAEGGGCPSLHAYVAAVREGGPTLLGELAAWDYFISGKPGKYWSLAFSSPWDPPDYDFFNTKLHPTLRVYPIPKPSSEGF